MAEGLPCTIWESTWPWNSLGHGTHYSHIGKPLLHKVHCRLGSLEALSVLTTPTPKSYPVTLVALMDTCKYLFEKQAIIGRTTHVGGWDFLSLILTLHFEIFLPYSIKIKIKIK